jgi:hypothetical protein
MDRRHVFAEIREAADAPTMLRRHAAYVRTINQSSAPIGWVVEQAAHHDQTIAELWQRMTNNRTFAANAAAEALMSKPGIRAGLSHQEFEDWILHYYRCLLL